MVILYLLLSKTVNLHKYYINYLEKISVDILKIFPLIFVIDKYETSWIDGDPLFIVVKNGQFTQVLY